MNNELIFFWIAVGCYALSAVAYLFGVMARKEPLLNWGMALTAVGLITHCIAVVFRWTSGGSPPFIETSESLTSGVLVAVLFFLGTQFLAPRLKAVGILVMPVCFILMGWAGTLAQGVAGPLPAALQSKWLWVHIFAASTGFSGVLVAAALGLLFLIKQKRQGGPLDRLPELSALDDLSYRFVSGGFLMLGLMIISGALWSSQVKGSYWNWDPVEVWSLITWLVYGIYLHLRITFGWRARIMAWYVLLALAVMIVSYWGIPFVADNFHAGFRIEHR